MPGTISSCRDACTHEGLDRWHAFASTPDVKHYNFGGVHEQGSHVSGVLLIPAQPQQRGVRLRGLVNNGGVLLVPGSTDNIILTDLKKFAYPKQDGDSDDDHADDTLEHRCD